MIYSKKTFINIFSLLLFSNTVCPMFNEGINKEFFNLENNNDEIVTLRIFPQKKLTIVPLLKKASFFYASLDGNCFANKKNFTILDSKQFNFFGKTYYVIPSNLCEENITEVPLNILKTLNFDSISKKKLNICFCYKEPYVKPVSFYENLTKFTMVKMNFPQYMADRILPTLCHDATDEKYDCYGFFKKVFFDIDLKIRMTDLELVKMLIKNAKKKSEKDLRPGDGVMFFSRASGGIIDPKHFAIYIGEDKIYKPGTRLYISKNGAGGSIDIQTMEAMRNDWKCDGVFGIDQKWGHFVPTQKSN